MPHATNSRTSAARRRLAPCLAAAACVLLLGAAPALAGPVWRITSAHGPTHMAPGGIGQYVVQAQNVGDADSDGSTITITDTLPPGVTATRAFGTNWSCTGIGTGTVVCHTNDVVRARGRNAAARGFAPHVYITVTVGSGVSGTADNAATVSGGGGASASITDATVFDPTPAGFGFIPGSFQADLFDAPFPSGSPVRKAGSHPYEAQIDLALNLALGHDPDDLSLGDVYYTTPDEHVRALATALPVGLIGNPQATPKCPGELLNRPAIGNKIACPANTQVGVGTFVINNGKTLDSPASDLLADVPLYNMEPPPGAVAAIAFEIVGNPVWIVASLDPTDHYRIVTTVQHTIELFGLRSAEITLWGVPADPVHDALRGNPDDPNDGVTAYDTPFAGAPIRPFLTMPSQCDVSAGSFQVRADSWQHPGAVTPWQAATPLQMTGCDDPRFRFNPSITVQPEDRRPGVPTGLDVDLTVPQKDDTVTDPSSLYASSGDDRAIATPPLRDVTVTLPQGMAVSPSSADGLAACNPLQIGLGTNAEPACPDASKIGSASITTPLLPDPLTGSVYLASQNANPFGSMLALYIVAKAPGVIVKLPGKVTPDPVTGQLTTTFDDNPQVPFSTLHLHLMGGPRAALVTPTLCGTKTTTATFTSWNASLPAVQTSDSFAISGDGNGGACTPRGFDPRFVAGTTNPIAGKDSPIVTRVSRSDADQELSSVDVRLPQGLLGRLAKVDLCKRAAAAAGTCGAGSRIGTVVVGAGPGSDPFFITDGRAYLTGPYKGAPFGLSLVVRAKAGPLDLGNVIVRAQVQVDPKTTALRVVTDPLPTILAGIPLQVRIAQVTVDRPHFTFNPTNCTELQANAHLVSTGGKTSDKHSRFQVTNCAALPFHPQISFTVGGKGHTRRGASTPLTTVLRMPKGNANLAGVQVVLPLSLGALLEVVTNSCTLAQYRAGHCAKARAGSAVAVTPLLKRPLRGGVFFVKDPHKPPGSLPNLMVALRGQVDIDLTGKIKIPGGSRLATNFDAVPDAPITKFTLRLVSGRHGPLGVVENLCTASGSKTRVGVTFEAQNGRAVQTTRRLQVAGCRGKGRQAKR